MPSGKRARQQRQATGAGNPPPAVRSKGAPRGARQASPRALAIGGGIALLVVVAIVLGVVLSSSSGAGSWPNTAQPQADWITGGTQVQQMLGGIPQHGLTLGSPTAPVTMVEYIDLQCPYCDEFETGVFPDIVNKYVRTGKLKVVARPLAFIGPDSVTGRKALIAAANQNRAFNFMAILYDNQRTENTGWLNDAMIKSAAESIPGMNPAQLNSQRTLASVAQAAAVNDTLAQKDQVSATPTLYVGTSLKNLKHVPITSPTDEATLVAAIKSALGNK